MTGHSIRPIRLWVLLPGAALILAAALLTWRVLFADLPDPGRAGSPPLPAASIRFEDRRGRLLYEAIAPNGNRHVPLPLSEIPLACRQATIATEDSRFYQHPGVDLLAIVRAAWLNWRGAGPFSGASTISQQLARNLYLAAGEREERTLRRKLREAWLAWRLERRYSKDEVLALYMNTSYYGHFAVGIEAAAQAYFGIHAAELDLAQCALLAGLLQYPAGYNPLEHPEAARRRQATVLGLMVHDGYITEREAQEAADERLAFAATPFPIEAPHFVMWVQGQLEDLLAAERVAAGGLRVITTLDLDWQRQAEEIVRRRLAGLRPCAAGPADPLSCDPRADPNRRIENAGLVALDPHTGAVLAMVGNPDYFDRATSGAVNTTLALRQPGSAIKPLTYALALDPQAAAGRQPWTAATLIADLRTVFITAEGRPYVPQNYDRTYHGPVTLRTALANSYNIPAVKALDYVGVDALIELANRLGIPWERSAAAQTAATDDRPSQPRYGLALTLGGGEVRLLDLTAAYAAFANGGHRVVPFAISRIETLDGKVIGEWGWTNPQSPFPNPPSLDPRVAYLITDILSDDVARRPAFGAGSPLEIGRPAAVKTGTTTDWRDNWTIGYTPDLVVGVWVGNADNTPMHGVSGVTGAAPIWHDFMRAILRNTPPRAFTRPDGLIRLEVCADSGLLPGGEVTSLTTNHQASNVKRQTSETVACPHRRYEWFIAGTEPTEVDRSHVRVAIDVRTGRPADASTPAAFVAEQVRWVLPDEYREWAREQGIELGVSSGRELTSPPAPPLRGEGSTSPLTPPLRGEGNTAPPAPRLQIALISPEPNRTYRIDPGLPADVQKLPITARLNEELRSRGATVTLLVDGAAWTAASAPDYTAWWTLRPGNHTFEAVVLGADGAHARSAAIKIFVEQ
ncbi:MAG: transglycosylase domain-containing protein [Anaerolineae bacterium]